MDNGKCISCGSDQVYRSLNGIVTNGKYIYVRNIRKLTPRSDRMTYICAQCGYYQDHIIDNTILNQITKKWEKV